MKKIVIITVVLGLIGYFIYQAITPDYVKVNHQMVEQCSQDKGICD